MPTSPTSPAPTINAPLSPANGYTTGVSSVTLQNGYTYSYDGAWNPNTTYKGATDAYGHAAAADIVEYNGAFWLANYINTDQAPTLSGQYGAWLQIGGNNSDAAHSNTIAGTIVNNSGNAIGAPTAGMQAPAFNPNPAVPSVVAALSSMHLSPTSEQLFWNAPAVYGTGDVSSYNVYEVVNNGGGSSSNILLGTTTATTFTVSNLSPSTSYTFMVAASDGAGNSGGLNAVTTTNHTGFDVTNYNQSISENPVAPGDTAHQENYTYTYTGYDNNGNPIQKTANLSFSTLPNSTVATTTLAAPSHALSGKYVSPYVDVTVPGNDLLQLAHASGTATTAGLTAFTLAFMQTDKADYTLSNGGDPQTGPFVLNTTNGAPVIPTLSFGGLSGLTPESTGTIVSEVKALQAGGDVITISFGGYSGLEPAVANQQYYSDLVAQNGAGYAGTAMAKAVANLQLEYQSVINTYGVNHLDFDIEGTATVNNDTASSIRNQALVGLEQANPGLSISFTVATTAAGLSDGHTASGGIGQPGGSIQNVLKVLQDAAAAGVKISTVNLMAMDYYDGNVGESAGATGTGQNAMYSNAVNAVQQVEQQLQAIAHLPTTSSNWTTPLIGITPMIGQNDDVGNGSPGSVDEVFTLQDAAALTAWAFTQPYVAGLGEWELPRDKNNATGTVDLTEAKQDSSGVIQSSTDQFTQIFLGISGANTQVYNSSTPQAYGTITGSQNVVFDGTGSATLQANNTYTGVTVVSGTTLALQGAGSIASSADLVLANSASILDISAASGDETVRLLTGAIGSKVYLGGHTLTVSGPTSSTFDGVISDGGSSGGSAGSLSVSAGETLTLTAAQGYTGHTFIYGTLDLAGAAGLGSSKNVALKAAGAVFDISQVSKPETILNLNGVAGSTIYLGDKSLRVNQSTAATYAGVISDGGVEYGGLTHNGSSDPGGALLVKGTATLTLTGTNTFTGGVTMQGGELQLGALNAGGASGHAIGFLAGAGATLAIQNAAMTGTSTNHSFATNPLLGFDTTDKVDLVNLAYVGDPVTSYNASTGVLTVVQGSYTDTVTFYGLSSGASFTASSDGHGGTLVQLHG